VPVKKYIFVTFLYVVFTVSTRVKLVFKKI